MSGSSVSSGSDTSSVSLTGMSKSPKQPKHSPISYPKPLLLDAVDSRFPEDIVIKINNIICDEYIRKIYERLETNLIRNVIKIFLNDKQLSNFLYYLGYQTYYCNYTSMTNYGIYGETLTNLEWGDYITETSIEDYNGIHDDITEPYMLNMPSDTTDLLLTDSDFYHFDVNIYSTKLTLNETLWIFNHYAIHDDTIFKDIAEYDHDTANTTAITNIANFEIHPVDTYKSVYDYDKEKFATVWNLFNRGFIKINIFKIIYIYCYNASIENTIQQYYTMLGGIGRVPIRIDHSKLFHKTCFNIIKYFNIKMKKAVEDSITLSYLYAIYADDDIGVYFNEDHEEQENRAFDILHDNGLLTSKPDNIIDILDLLYVSYLR